MTAEERFRLRIDAEHSEVARACVRAEFAAYTARMGDYDEAKAMIAKLRSEPTWRSSRLTALLMLAEAIIALRNEYDKTALDRLSRGYAIASAFGERDVAASLAAWLAQFNYNGANRKELKFWVDRCAESANEMNEHARIRFALTQASIAGYIGNTSASNMWYQAARKLSLVVGDKASLAAAMYNRPALAISRARVHAACGVEQLQDLDQLLLEIGSAVNYTGAIGNTAATGFHRLWLGRLHLLRDDILAGAALISDALESMPEASEPHVLPGIKADLAICRLRLGDIKGLQQWIPELPIDVEGVLQADDGVVYFSQLTEIAQRLEDSRLFNEAQERRETCLGEYAIAIEELRNCLTEPTAMWREDRSDR